MIATLAGTTGKAVHVRAVGANYEFALGHAQLGCEERHAGNLVWPCLQSMEQEHGVCSGQNTYRSTPYIWAAQLVTTWQQTAHMSYPGKPRVQRLCAMPPGDSGNTCVLSLDTA